METMKKVEIILTGPSVGPDLRPRPVKPFAPGSAWVFNDSIDPKTKAELLEAQKALNRPEVYEKLLVGFDPLPE